MGIGRAHVLAIALAAPCALSSTAFAGTAATFLASVLALSPHDVQEVTAGRAVAELLPASDPREVALLGAIRIDVAPATYVAQLSDIVHFKRDRAVLEIGTFSNPPRLADVRRLTLDDADVDALQSCRLNDCDLNLSASLIARAGGTNAWFRQTLVDYVAAYGARGNAALMSYAGADDASDVGREFRSLAAGDAVLSRFPALRRFLLNPTDTPPAVVTNVIYWSKEKVGPKVVVSVTDLVVTRTAAASPVAYVAASKQIYASRLFDSSLSVTLLLDDGTGGTDVVYVNRSRVDAFHGWFGSIARRLVRHRAPGAVARYLRRTKERLESATRLARS